MLNMLLMKAANEGRLIFGKDADGVALFVRSYGIDLQISKITHAEMKSGQLDLNVYKPPERNMTWEPEVEPAPEVLAPNVLRFPVRQKHVPKPTGGDVA